MNNIFPLLLAFLALFLIVKLILNKKKTVISGIPTSIEPEEPRCKTFLVTRLDPSAKSVVIFDNCSGSSESLELISDSIEICARDINHTVNVKVEKIFDYCVK